MPVWHVSVSLQHAPEHDGATGYFIVDPARAEPIAIGALRGVGGEHEWWMPEGEQATWVSHLRVPTTPVEQRSVPAGLVTMDAGSTGPRRSRSR